MYLSKGLKLAPPPLASYVVLVAIEIKKKTPSPTLSPYNPLALVVHLDLFVCSIAAECVPAKHADIITRLAGARRAHRHSYEVSVGPTRQRRVNMEDGEREVLSASFA